MAYDCVKGPAWLKYNDSMEDGNPCTYDAGTGHTEEEVMSAINNFGFLLYSQCTSYDGGSAINEINYASDTYPPYPDTPTDTELLEHLNKINDNRGSYDSQGASTKNDSFVYHGEYLHGGGCGSTLEELIHEYTQGYDSQSETYWSNLETRYTLVAIFSNYQKYDEGCSECYEPIDGLCAPIECPEGYGFSGFDGNCCCPVVDLPPMNPYAYSYSGEWTSEDENWEQNNQYCINGEGTVETGSYIGNDSCITKFRCKYIDKCIDVPFPPKEEGDECKFGYDDCEPFQYSEPWCSDYHACGGGTAGYTESHDCVGDMLDFGSYWVDGKRVSYYTSDGEVEHAYINCLDMSRCKYRKNWRYYPPKLPYYTPPGTPGGKWIENPPPEDPNIPPYIPPFKPIPVPPTPPPPCHPCPKPGPELPDGCCDTTSDNDLYEWCDCDIIEDIPTSGGCFEKPISRQTTHCCDYSPKDYRRWTVSFDYKNKEDSLWIK